MPMESQEASHCLASTLALLMQTHFAVCAKPGDHCSACIVACPLQLLCLELPDMTANAEHAGPMQYQYTTQNATPTQY